MSSIDRSNLLKPKLDDSINKILENKIQLPRGFSQNNLKDTKDHLSNLTAQLSILQANLNHFSNYLAANDENLWQFIKNPIGHKVLGSDFNTDWLQQHITAVSQTQERISKEFDTLGSRLEQIEAPVVGRVSFSLRNAISTFPIAVAIGFLACSILLVQAIRARRVFDKINYGTIIIDLHSLWVDPEDSSKYFKLFMFAIGPVAIFAIAAGLDLSVVDQVDKFPLFPFSPEFNKNLLTVSVILGIILFFIAILIIILNVRKK